MIETDRKAIYEHLVKELARLEESHTGNDAAVESCADENEYASRLSEQNLNLALQQRESRRITEIRETMRRIDHSDFGECEECGDDIGLARLKANPTAQMCINCQAKFESGQLAVAG
jgi:DnaK suppressor protein